MDLDSNRATLARLVKERRDALGLSRPDIKGRGGPSDFTLAQIEQSAPVALRAKTRRQLETALGLSEGWADRVLDGTATEADLNPPLPDARQAPLGRRVDPAWTAARAARLDRSRAPVDVADVTLAAWLVERLEARITELTSAEEAARKALRSALVDLPGRPPQT